MGSVQRRAASRSKSVIACHILRRLTRGSIWTPCHGNIAWFPPYQTNELITPEQLWQYFPLSSLSRISPESHSVMCYWRSAMRLSVIGHTQSTLSLMFSRSLTHGNRTLAMGEESIYSSGTSTQRRMSWAKVQRLLSFGHTFRQWNGAASIHFALASAYCDELRRMIHLSFSSIDYSL